MDVREKLVELICRFCSGLAVSDITPPYGYENLADFMISNGVTVQENVKMSDELLKQLKNAPITICKEESSIETVQEWISVKDRLPETNGYHVWVIACVDGKRSCVRMFERKMVRGKMVERFKYPWESISDENITHWCELPQPPKGE